MTLILTEISPAGIVMGADSAFTPLGGGDTQYGQKVFPVHYIRGGVSFWGNYLPQDPVRGIRPDEWIENFIDRNDDAVTVDEFAMRLRDALRRELRTAGPFEDKDGTLHASLGYHVAGHGANGQPILYHVHNGISEVLRDRGETVDPHLINANQDLRPGDAGAPWKQGQLCMWRNGDYHLYATIIKVLEPLFECLSRGMPTRMGDVRIPADASLNARAQWVAAQIKMMAAFYGASNVAELLGTTRAHIGGPVRILKIDPTTGPGTVKVIDF